MCKKNISFSFTHVLFTENYSTPKLTYLNKFICTTKKYIESKSTCSPNIFVCILTSISQVLKFIFKLKVNCIIVSLNEALIIINSQNGATKMGKGSIKVVQSMCALYLKFSLTRFV